MEKNFEGARLKDVKKIFLFCSPSGERKRWAGFLPVMTEILAQKRFALRSVIAKVIFPNLGGWEKSFHFSVQFKIKLKR